jgi:hypothetical protein
MCCVLFCDLHCALCACSGYAFAQTNNCRAYFELSDFANVSQVGRIFDEAVIAVASPPQQKEVGIFIDSLIKGTGTPHRTFVCPLCLSSYTLAHS